MTIVAPNPERSDATEVYSSNADDNMKIFNCLLFKFSLTYYFVKTR
jgi:hypothetical protein